MLHKGERNPNFVLWVGWLVVAKQKIISSCKETKMTGLHSNLVGACLEEKITSGKLE